MVTSEFSDVFLSYRRTDVEFAKQMADAFRAAGKEVWVDWEDIPPGSEGFTDDIKRGLEGTTAFVCVLSPDYLDSPYCVDMELNYAAQLKKKIVPVVWKRIKLTVFKLRAANRRKLAFNVVAWGCLFIMYLIIPCLTV